MHSRREDTQDAPACPPGKAHVIYPKIGATDHSIAAALAHIHRLITPDDVYTKKLRGKRVIFWRAMLTTDQAKELQSDENVSVVSKSCTDKCYDPLDLINRQIETDPGLVTFGVDPEKKVPWYRNSYLFDSKAGQGIKHFIIDSGADLSRTVSDTRQLS